MVMSRRRRTFGMVTTGPGCWWWRRNAVLRQAVLQYVCRPTGAKDWWQTGHGVVPSSSRDGVRSGGVLVGAGTVTGHVPFGGGLVGGVGSAGVAHAVGLAGGDDDGGVVQEPVQAADGGGVLGQEPSPLVE